MAQANQAVDWWRPRADLDLGRGFRGANYLDAPSSLMRFPEADASRGQRSNRLGVVVFGPSARACQIRERWCYGQARRGVLPTSVEEAYHLGASMGVEQLLNPLAWDWVSILHTAVGAGIGTAGSTRLRGGGTSLSLSSGSCL